MDISVKVMFDVSPKLEELVFHIIAAQFTNQQAAPTPARDIEQAAPVVKAAPPADSSQPAPEPEPEKKVEPVKGQALAGDALLQIRKEASEFMAKDKSNKIKVKEWLDAHGIERVTLMTPALVPAFRKEVLGIAG